MLENIVVGTDLTHLDRSHTDLNNGIVFHILARSLPRGRTLTHLNLSNNRALGTYDGVIHIVRAPFPALVHLDLSGVARTPHKEQFLLDSWRDTGRTPAGLRL
jgi:hypothetical protein